MAHIAYSEVLSPEGDVVWRGAPEDRNRAVVTLGAWPSTALAALCRVSDLPSCTRGEVRDAAERLKFVSRQGTNNGFLVVLPRATLVDQVIEAFNLPHLAELRASRIDFPLLFSRADPATRALIDGYERQGRMFRIAEPDSDLRLAYAADPGLFAWLAGRRLRRADLPYTVYSPMPVFRRWQSGELSLDKMRQYPVPDVHILCPGRDASAEYQRAVTYAARSLRFWVGEDFAQSVDLVEDSPAKVAGLAGKLARAATCYTLVNVLSSRPRYYSVKGGLMVYAGFGTVMLYNFQLDDANGERFGFRVDDGEPATVIHATLAGGWPKMLPLVLGRGLADIGPRAIPAELAWHQIVCVPVADRHLAHARNWADRLRDLGLRAGVPTDAAGPLGRRLAGLREEWQPLRVVVGDRETAGPVVVEANDGKCSLPLEEFLLRYQQRLDRCRPAAVPSSDPPLLT
jgi:threonyl-tRNA synthetase